MKANTARFEMKMWLNKAVEDDVELAALMDTPIGRMIQRKFEEKEEHIHIAQQIMENCDENIVESNDGSIILHKTIRRANIPFANLKDTGLADIIINEYPEYIAVSPTINDTKLGNISGFSDSVPTTSVSVSYDDDYKYARAIIINGKKSVAKHIA